MTGPLLEHMVVAKLSQKCDIKKDPTYDHVYKLDFIVNKFKEVDKFAPIGVQITQNAEDEEKQEIFLRERQKKTLVDRSLYIRVQYGVDIEHYGAELIYNAIMAFAFQQYLRKFDVLGVEIKKDVTYDFFSLQDPEEPLFATQAQKTEASNNRLEMDKDTSPKPGKIIKYAKEKGFGFIEGPNRQQWFFHISEIEEEELKVALQSSVIQDPYYNNLVTPIPITFVNAGLTRRDADKPTAVKIKRTSQLP